MPPRSKLPVKIQEDGWDRVAKVAVFDQANPWQRFQSFDDATSFSHGKIAHSPEEQPEKRENDKLRRERFCGRHAYLRSGVHVNSAVAFARDRAGDVVANSKGAKAFAPAFTQCTERVGSFAALADGEHQRLRSHRRITMAELARVIDFGGDVRQLLDQVFADSAGMQRRAATGENDASYIAQFSRCHVQATEFCCAFLSVETAAHRITHRVWLLKDFLEHVVGIITLLNVLGCELDFADGMLGDVSGKRTDLELVRPRSH